MSEPTYVYVKGEGWVIEQNIITLACGTRVRWEIKQWNELTQEDRCVAFYASRTVDECVQIAKTRHFSGFSRRTLGGLNDYQYFVAVPV